MRSTISRIKNETICPDRLTKMFTAVGENHGESFPYLTFAGISCRAEKIVFVDWGEEKKETSDIPGRMRINADKRD